MEPTQETWKQLYAAAITFQEAAPWHWMWDTEVFGVQDPESGEIGYCCVMGRLGEHFALAVYQGSEGLAGLWEMRQGPRSAYPVEILATQKCLMASFENRSMLQQPDLRILRQLGLKFRGRNAWPQFRSYRPGYAPWYLTEAEAHFLTVALQQALDVALRLRDDPALLAGPGRARRRTLLQPARPQSKYLVRVLENREDGWEWKDTWQKPEPLEIAGPSAAPVNRERVERLRKRLRPSDGIVEMDFGYLPSTIYGEGDERPWYPYVVLAVEPESGMVLGHDIVPPDEIAVRLPEKLLDVVEQVGKLPAAVVVQREETRTYLAPTIHQLGIQLVRVPRLGALEEARRSLTEFMSR